MSSFPLQSSVMSLQHSPAALWARVNMCWSWFPVTHVRIGYLTHKNWLSRQTKQGRELLACPESSPSVWCQLNLLSLMDVLIFKQNGWSCKNWNWNIFVTWLDSFGKEVWNWLLDSEVVASGGEGTMRQTAGQTERQMEKLWSFGPASQNFTLVLFLIKNSLARIALPDAFHLLIIIPASKTFQGFMDGWRFQYTLHGLNEAEQKLAETGLLSLLFSIQNRMILRGSNQVYTEVVFQLSPFPASLSSAVLILCLNKALKSLWFKESLRQEIKLKSSTQLSASFSFNLRLSRCEDTSKSSHELTWFWHRWEATGSKFEASLPRILERSRRRRVYRKYFWEFSSSLKQEKREGGTSWELVMCQRNMVLFCRTSSICFG